MDTEGNHRDGSRAARKARSEQLRAEEAKRSRRRSALVQMGVIAVAVVVVIGLVVLFLNTRDDGGPPAAAPSGMTTEGGYLVGDDDAPVKITVVEDFQCPVCRAFEEQSGELLASYGAGDQVSVEYRPIAFLTRYSSRAANAAACVVDENPANFMAFHKALFANQPPEQSDGLTDDQLTDLAIKAGADADVVGACIADESFSDWVSDRTSTVQDDPGFKGTPWVQVNGTTLTDWSPTAIEAAVQDASQ